MAALIPLTTRGNAPTALLVDATTFDPPAGREDDLNALRSLLTRQQISHYVIEHGFPFKPIDRIKRQRSDLKVLPGSGRVIRVEIEEEI